MKSTNYSDKTLEHFREPRNVGTLEGGNVALGRVGNPVCGDLMEIYIRVEDDRIADITFQTFGCGSAVATSSMTTELVKGMTLDEALAVSRGDVADALDGLPPVKMHCSNLAADALHAAVENWRAGIKPEDADTRPIEGKCGTGAAPEAEAVEAGAIDGLASLAGSGAYTSVSSMDEFEDLRVVVIENGDASAELAIELCGHAARVVLMTTGTELSNVSQPVRMALKLSDVKVLYEARPLEVAGEGEVERVRVHDLNEDEEYELTVDAVVMLDAQ